MNILEKSGHAPGERKTLIPVPCILKYNGEMMAAKIRLKGDRRIHYMDGNVSYRLELNGDNYIMGMQKFSIHKPRARNYVYENLFYYALERENLLSLRYSYVRVYFNNKDIGIYALEQFPDKSFIESSSKRAGPILHLSEDINTINIDSMEVRVLGKEIKDLDGQSVYTAQKKLLHDFKTGHIKVGDVFEINKLAGYFALCDVLGFPHATLAKNIRFYFNPITGKIEPIGYDGHFHPKQPIFISGEMGVNKVADPYYSRSHKWYYLFFSNPDKFDYDFMSAYISSLKRVSEKKYLDELFKELNPQIMKDWALLRKYSYPLHEDQVVGYGSDTFKYSTVEIYRRQEYIRALLEKKSRVSAILLGNEKGTVKIGVLNKERLPLEILSVSYNGKKYPTSSVVLLPAVNWESDTSYSVMEVSIPNYVKGELKIESTVVGLNEPFWDKVFDGNEKISYGKNLLIRIEKKNEQEIKNLIKDFSFLSFTSQTGIIELKSGYWELNKPLVIPSGYIVKAGPGVEINMKNGSYIIFHSPIKFEGTETRKIKFFSTDTTGMGMLVCSDGKENKMVHVEFSNLREIISDRMKLTGAVTFYESPVNIYYCSFLKMQAEDALNIIRSDFELAWSLFQKSFSDGFDGDFVNGKIQDCTFEGTGNDAIDGSGSIIEVKRVIMKNIGDKGISSGEVSTIIAQNCYVDSAKVGYVSKDLSYLTLKNCYVNNAVYGLAAYQKKPQFGHSFISADRVGVTGVKTGFIVEEKSYIIIDNQKIEPNTRDAVLFLYDDL